mmetsp:Transcript_51154/g.65468  ORF Transcript_51154/g.65468 Transcript_51154/m.65468 type:complete len:116 (+) Transcript_51154:351-698(+)
MIAVLEEARITTPIAQRVANSFETVKPKLRWMLKCTGFGQRSIVDLKWRLDYHVRSSTTGVEHVPAYFVSLKTVEADGVTFGNEDFTCSQEQMHDLVSVVRDATKQVERMLSASN